MSEKKTKEEEQREESISIIASTFAGSFIDDDEALKRVSLKSKESVERERQAKRDGAASRGVGSAKQQMETKSQQDMYRQRGDRRMPKSFTVTPDVGGPEFG